MPFAGAGGAAAGGHTTHGVGGHSRQSSGAVKTRCVHAVTTTHGQPGAPGVHATPLDVKHAGVAQSLFTVATQKALLGCGEQLTCAMFCSCTFGLPTDGSTAPLALGNTLPQVPYEGAATGAGAGAVGGATSV